MRGSQHSNPHAVYLHMSSSWQTAGSVRKCVCACACVLFFAREFLSVKSMSTFISERVELLVRSKRVLWEKFPKINGCSMRAGEQNYIVTFISSRERYFLTQTIQPLPYPTLPAPPHTVVITPFADCPWFFLFHCINVLCQLILFPTPFCSQVLLFVAIVIVMEIILSQGKISERLHGQGRCDRPTGTPGVV